MKKSILTLVFALVLATVHAQVVRIMQHGGTEPTKFNVKDIKEMVYVPSQDFHINVFDYKVTDNYISLSLDLGADIESAGAFLVTEDIHNKYADRSWTYKFTAHLIDSLLAAGKCVPLKNDIHIALTSDAHDDKPNAFTHSYTVVFFAKNKYIKPYTKIYGGLYQPQYDGDYYIQRYTVMAYD